jgi:hypothetical protein
MCRIFNETQENIFRDYTKLIVTQLVKLFPSVMEPEVSLLCSQKPAIVHYPEAHEYSPHLPTVLLIYILILYFPLRVCIFSPTTYLRL